MLKLSLILLNKENIKKEPDHKLNRRILTSLISKTLLTARRLDLTYFATQFQLRQPKLTLRKILHHDVYKFKINGEFEIIIVCL